MTMTFAFDEFCLYYYGRKVLAFALLNWFPCPSL
jgi:hypothetical protein